MFININLNQLRAFYMTACCGGITKAAKKLYVSPPAVTMQIKKLEQWLGLKLICKSRAQFTLTDQGKTIFGMADKIFSHVFELEDYIAKAMGRVGSEVVFGVHHVPAKYIMPDIVDHVQKIHPEISIHFVLGAQQEFIEKIKNRSIDIAIIIKDIQDPDIQTIPLLHDDLVLVVAGPNTIFEKSTMPARGLNGVPLLVQQKETGAYDSIQEYLSKFCVTPRIVKDGLSSDIIKQFLLKDKCAAFLPSFAIRDELANGSLQAIRLEEGYPGVQMSLAFLTDSNLPRSLESLLQSLSTFSFCSFSSIPRV